MQITLYSFNKRINSTKIVDVSGTTVDFTYKDESDIYNPIIELSYNINGNNINYAKIDNRYYFINSIDTVRMNLWRLHLKIDLLATFKDEILNTEAYVRFSTNKYNSNLVDARIITSGNWNTKKVVAPMDSYSLSGYFVLSVIGDAGDATGFTTNYILSPAMLNSLVLKLLEPDTWEELKQFFTNPMEAIVSCWWCPLDLANMVALSAKQIKIGAYDTGLTGQIIATNRGFTPYSASKSIRIPFQYSDFRNLEPYTTIRLYLPFVGYIDIDSSDVYGADELYIQYGIDVITGAIEYIIKPSKVDLLGDVIATANGSVKLELPVGQVQSNIGALLSGVAGGVAALSLLGGGMIFPALTSTAYALTSVMQRRQTFQNGGFQGTTLPSVVGDNRNFAVYLRYRETSDTPENMRVVQGGLCSKVLHLSSCSGYVLTENASVTIPGYYEATSQINSMLNGGIFIE